MRTRALIFTILLSHFAFAQKKYTADVIVYGGTASAVMAAVQVKNG